MTSADIWRKQYFALVPGRHFRNEPLSRHNTFRIGGPADLFSIPAGAESLVAALDFLSREKIPYLIIGGGSNSIFSDAGFRGVVIKPPPLRTGLQYRPVAVDGCDVTAAGGMTLQALIVDCARAGLSGLENLAGIPGTVGGAVCMNAGAYGSCISDRLTGITIASQDLGVLFIEKPRLTFGYRTSSLLTGDVSGAVVEVSFTLDKGQTSRAIMNRVIEITRERRVKYKRWQPCAGSFFKNPPESQPAGKLIDELGLKGTKVGGAMVSERHANFIVNTGGATCADVLELSEIIREKVLAATGVTLQREVIIHGDGAQ